MVGGPVFIVPLPGKLILSTDRAAGILLHTHAAPLGALRVQDLKSRWLADARDELDRLHRLHRADHAGKRREYAHRRALHFVDLRVLGEEAGVAGRLGFAKVEDHELAIEADRSAGNERLRMPHARAV